jgi:UDP-3-O-[3-hydroxymyristoyl] glucosamine N-acyltransferase
MVDTRFHLFSGPSALPALLEAVGRAVEIDDERFTLLTIAGAAELDTAGPDQIALAASKDYLDALRATAAGAVVVVPSLRDYVPATAIPIVVDRPHQLFAALLGRLYPADTRASVKSMVDGTSVEPRIEEGALIGENVVLGPGVEIGSGTYVGPNSVIGPGVAIGRDSTVGPNCSIECAYVGSNVVLHAGVRIGTEGFGWLDFGETNTKIPQLGRVILQDNVEVGANSTIDRGALGDTVIGEGTKIDNLVQIGHNCRIGRYCLIAGTSGLAGSTILGDGVLVGAGAGTAGHLTIGDGSVVYARAGVTKSWPPGSKIIGAPAQDVRGFWRELAALRRLGKGGRQ